MKLNDNIRLKRILRVLFTLVLTCVMVGIAAHMLERKDGDIKYRAFLEEENNYDILFMGTSHVIDAVYPMELWHDSGYTSYNLANHSTTLAASYWMLVNALDHTEPRLVVIDCYGLNENEKITNYSYTHQAFDAFPLSINKIKTAFDLTDMYEEYDPLELLFDFSLYHSRWNELGKSDFDTEYNAERGSEHLIALATPVEYEWIDPDEKMQERTIGWEYLERMIKECQSRNIEVLLTWVPYPPHRAEAQAAAHSVYDIAEEYGVDYIDFWDMDLVDFETDLSDEDSHLNPSGGLKVTDCIGQYIDDNLALADHRNEEGYEGWHRDEMEYAQDKKDNLIYETDPVIYLMLAADDDFDIKLEWNDYSSLDTDRYASLFENLGLESDSARQSATQYISGRRSDRSVEYREECELDLDQAYDVSITLYDADSGEQFDNVWLDYDASGESTISHIYY